MIGPVVYTFALLLGLVASAAAQSGAPDRDAILAGVERYFAAMKARDTGLMDAASRTDGSMVSVHYQSGAPSIASGTIHVINRSLAALPEVPIERLFAAEVWQDGDVASVWAPYQVLLGDRVLHCGYDAFHLVRETGQWRLAGAIYTARPGECDAIQAAARTLPGDAPAAERTAVLAAIEQFFDGMRRRDTVQLTASFSPRAAWIIVSYRDGTPTVFRRLAAEDNTRVARSPDRLDERLLDTVVRVDGDIAIVWGSYEFRVGNRVTHCGYDGFHLVREEGWRLEGGVYTVRPDGCAGLRRP